MNDKRHIKLNTPHAGQLQVLQDAERFNTLACGRRWGKTTLGEQLAIECALTSNPVGWFAPTYKYLDLAWVETLDILHPLGDLCKPHKQERQIKLWNGGLIDFWSLERDDAGRSRKYKRVVLDEAAFARNLKTQWTKSIRPTLTDLRGDAWFLSNPRGHNYFQKLWSKGGKERDWVAWQMPTATNPFIDKDEIEAARQDLPADAYQQEYLAEFLSDAANPFGIEAIRSCVMPDMAPGPVAAWGVDLAKSVDWTVAVGLNVDGQTCAFQRWQSDWRNTTARLRGMLGDIPAAVDSTGVGDPIVEDLQAKCSSVEGYTFTSKSKQQLMEGLAVAIQTQAIAYPEGPIVNELECFEYEYRPSGVRYTAPSGLHDDCVMALALAWYKLSRQPMAVTIDVGDGGAEQRWDAWQDRANSDEAWQ